MKIRQAKPEDISIVVQFAGDIAFQHNQYDPQRFCLFKDHINRLEEYFKKELKNPQSIIILLLNEEEIIGFSFVKKERADLETMAPDSAYLCDIYVVESDRRKEGGQLLIEASKKAALQLGAGILLLHVANQNSIAKAFFLKNGFKETLSEMLIIL